MDATISGKRISCLVPLVHNRSGVFGAKPLFLASMSCVKVFRSKFKGISFQEVYIFAAVKVSCVLTTCHYFDNPEVVIFDACGLQCQFYYLQLLLGFEHFQYVCLSTVA